MCDGVLWLLTPGPYAMWYLRMLSRSRSLAALIVYRCAKLGNACGCVQPFRQNSFHFEGFGRWTRQFTRQACI